MKLISIDVILEQILFYKLSIKLNINSSLHRTIQFVQLVLINSMKYDSMKWTTSRLKLNYIHASPFECHEETNVFRYS